MPTTTREQLQKLRIDKSQRPIAPTPSAGRRPAQQRQRSLFWPIFLVVLFGSLGAVGYLYREPIGSTVQNIVKPPAEARLVTVTMQKGASTPAVHTAVGKIVSDHRVRVATKVSGQITQLMFEQGDKLEKGQVIATIEDVFFRARRDNAKAVFEEQKARLEFAKSNFDRIKKLWASTVAPEIEYIQAKSEFEAAQAKYDADNAALTEAQWRLDWCSVTAPVTGVVLDRNVEVGDFVAAEGGFGGMANSQFASIADMTKLRVEVDVSELDITKISKDMPAVIIPDAYKDRRYKGHVLWIDPGANYSKGTVQVKVRIDNPDEYLRVEGTARVDFKKEQDVESADATKGTLWLPKSAVMLDGGGTSASPALQPQAGSAPATIAPTSGYVLVYSEERLTRTAVKIGRETERLYEITAGVSPGTRVADSPANYKDGQRVKPPGA